MMYFIFFIAIFICSNPDFQDMFARLLGKEKSDTTSGYLSAFSIGIIIILLYNLTEKKDKVSEDFLFKVSDFSPRCNGLYFGKPTTFQYDRIGCNYNKPVGGNVDMIINETNGESIKSYCHEDKNSPLGYIGDKNAVRYDGDPKMFTNFGDTN
jgi:hypothetical protein